MTSQPTEIAAPPRALMIAARIFLWCIWAMLLLGVLSFVFVEVVILNNPSRTRPTPDMHAITILFAMNILGGIVVIGGAHAARFLLLRLPIAKRSPTALLILYVTTKLVTWFVCDGVISFALVLVILADQFGWFLPFAALVWLILVADAPLFLPFRKFNHVVQ